MTTMGVFGFDAGEIVMVELHIQMVLSLSAQAAIQSREAPGDAGALLHLVISHFLPCEALISLGHILTMLFPYSTCTTIF